MGPATAFDMSVASNSVITIPRLRDDGANWIDYESKARTAMGGKGLIRHMDGTARKPNPYPLLKSGEPTADGINPATDEQIDAKEKRLDEFEQKEYMARNVLLTTTSPRLCAKIRDKTAAEMWALIKSDATSKGPMYVIDARRRLAEMRCVDSAGVKAHLNALVRARDELISMGAHLDDSEFVQIVLQSLPAPYRPLLDSITGASSISGIPISSDKLMALVIQKAHTDELTEPQVRSAETAMHASGQSTGKRSQRRPKGDRFCENCKRTNHDTPDCFQKGGAKEGQAPWQRKSPDSDR